MLFGDFGSTYRWIPAQTLRILDGNLAILWGQLASFWEIAFGCDRTLNHKLWKYHATWTLIINLMLPDLPSDEVGSRGCTNSMVKRKWYVHRLDSSVHEGTQVTWGSGPNSLFLIHDSPLSAPTLSWRVPSLWSADEEEKSQVWFTDGPAGYASTTWKSTAVRSYYSSFPGHPRRTVLKRNPSRRQNTK